MTDLRRSGDDEYQVIHDGQVIGAVHKARHRSDRYPYGEAALKGRGRWRWHASSITDEDFGTRRDAVSELVRRFQTNQ